MYTPTGEDPELDELVKLAILGERTRIERNKERREARERLKGKAAGIGGGGASGAAGSPPASVAGSPGAGGGGGGGVSDQGSPAASSVAFGGGVGSASGTPVKGGRGGGGRRSKDGTARKCAECGQVGHIKTNRKSVLPPFLCSVCGGEEEEEGVDGGELVGKGAGDRGGKERSVGEVRSERRREKIKRAKGAFAGDTVSGLVL